MTWPAGVVFRDTQSIINGDPYLGVWPHWRGGISNLPRPPLRNPWSRLVFENHGGQSWIYGDGIVTVDTVLHGPPEVVVSKPVELVDMSMLPARIRGTTDASGRHVFTNLRVGHQYIAIAFDDSGEFNPPAAKVVAVLPSAPEEPPPEEPA
jgi:hypothetical protein